MCVHEDFEIHSVHLCQFNSDRKWQEVDMMMTHHPCLMCANAGKAN